MRIWWRSASNVLKSPLTGMSYRHFSKFGIIVGEQSRINCCCHWQPVSQTVHQLCCNCIIEFKTSEYDRSYLKMASCTVNGVMYAPCFPWWQIANCRPYHQWQMDWSALQMENSGTLWVYFQSAFCIHTFSPYCLSFYLNQVVHFQGTFIDWTI